MGLENQYLYICTAEQAIQFNLYCCRVKQQREQQQLPFVRYGSSILTPPSPYPSIAPEAATGL